MLYGSVALKFFFSSLWCCRHCTWTWRRRIMPTCVDNWTSFREKSESRFLFVCEYSSLL